MGKLLFGDCFEMMAGLEAASIDCILADLPYGITQAKWDCELPLDRLWSEYKRLAKPGCPIVLFASQPFTSKLIASNFAMFKYCWYWEKEKGTGFLNTAHQPLRCIEEICVFYDKAKYNAQMIPLDKPYRHKLPTCASETINSVGSFELPVKYKNYTHSHPKNLLRYPRDNSNKGVHSTQKPLALLEYLVKTYSNEGDCILDNTMGSGTTCLAAKNLNRGYIGIEIDKNMFEIAVQRMYDNDWPEKEMCLPLALV